MFRKLNEKIDRFCAGHPGFGIENLMRYIVLGNVLVYLLTVFFGSGVLSPLWLDVGRVLHGEVWRLVTFLFVPSYGNVFFMAIALYFYYSLGNALENRWGTGRFTVYYLSGVLLTVLATFIGYFFGAGIPVAGADYVNLSIFFAFAMLYPDMMVLLFFIIPVKIKWVAWVDAAWFLLSVAAGLMRGNIVGALLPVVALLNFLVFFSPDFAYWGERARTQSRPEARQYRAAARQEEKREAQQGWHHRCSVCGRTDTDNPDLTFRYCSRCAGYHCYCADHIFNHIHFTDEADNK